ncbi:MAG: copper resistance protein CopC [Acidimicrobiales bacterium]|nr:copper resistance protein CopC [Acidimicrobiales bacterium]
MRKRSTKQGLLGLALCFLLLGLGAEKIYAHTQLAESSPDRKERVSNLTEIVLTFSSEVLDDGKAKISLTTLHDGKEVPIGDTMFVSEYTIRADVYTQPAPGQYVVRYRVTALDGDLNDSGYAFEVLASKGNDATWIVLGVGIAVIAAVVAVLRKNPKKEKE